MVQIEELAGQIDQVNVPGTWQEYPNWRVRIPMDADALPAGSAAQSVAHAPT